MIKAVDANGNQVWSYATGSYGLTELDTISEMGTIAGQYYLCENGAIIAFDYETGEILWRNEQFEGAIIAFDSDPNGNLYICGYYGPDLFIVDKSGNTVKRIESISNHEYNWPYKIDYEDGSVTIEFFQEDENGYLPAVLYDIESDTATWYVLYQ